MAETATRAMRWESLERWSPTAFLVAGVLLALFGALLGVEAFMDRAAPEDIFGPAGFLVAMVGVLGICPTLADRTPALARVTAVFAAVAAVGWSVITALSIVEAIGVLPPLEDVGVLGLTIILVVGVAMVLAYISCGVASLGVDGHSRTASLLLLGPPTIFAVMLTGGAIGYTPAWSAFALGSGQALVHLALWATLRTEGKPTDRAEPTPTEVRHG
ncbi:hypothetical protein [Halomontanus rarus]|uniref:hypothetical protein n=1 Tax=Halomontanus rarus TaxID=3034020 RepID=UPI001A996A63